MVVSPSDVSSTRKTPSPRSSNPPPIPSRRPLTPSERPNATISRRPKTKEIASRYLTPHSSSSSTTSSSHSSNTTSSSLSQRFHSPSPSSKRSQSAHRARAPDQTLSSARTLCTTTRSLSVSFQGEAFFYQTSKAKKQTPERRRVSTPVRTPQPADFHQRWPAARKNDFLALLEDGDGVKISSGGIGLGSRVWGETRGSMRRALGDGGSPVRPCSPSRMAGSPARARGGGAVGNLGTANAPSILSFAAEVRRSRKGESRIEEAHVLRLWHNRMLQWRFVNARIEAVLRVQRMGVEVIFGL